MVSRNTGADDPLLWEWDVDPLTRAVEIPDGDLAEIEENLEECSETVFQNAKFDIRALVSAGLEWKQDWFGRVHDTLLMGHLLASGEPHDLTTMALRYLRIDIKPYEDALQQAVTECRRLVRNKEFIEKYGEWRIAKKNDPGLPSARGDEKLWKWDMWLPRAVAKATKLSPAHTYWTVCRDYHLVDSGVTLPLGQLQIEILQDRGLFALYQLRRRLIEIIYKMEKRGVTYNRKRLKELRAEYVEQAAHSEKVCLALSGGKLASLPKSGTSKAMREVLFSDFKLVPLKYSDKTGEPSVDKTTLEAWMAELPEQSKPGVFVKNLRGKRQRDTAVSYMDGYERAGLEILQATLGDAVRWSDIIVLHPSLNPTGTATLRFSSSNPNEQNISKQEGFNLRYCFGPAPGREWWSLDYENLELRIPAYEAGEAAMIELFEHPDRGPYYGSYHLLVFDILHPEKFAKYGADCKKVFKSTWYQWTKNGNFAVQYGAQEESGTADTAYHVKGAQHRIKERFTAISELSKQTIAFAARNGYVNTMIDREMGAYPLQVKRDAWGKIKPTVPLSYHVQGTAMWCMCRAMVRAQEYIASLPNHFTVMQVHDELVFDFPRSKLPGGNLPKILKLKSLMEESGNDIGIPLKVDYAYHPNNWAKTEDVPAVAV